MKIGIMLREIANQHDAPGIIVLNLLDELLDLDRENHYTLIFSEPSFMDRYANLANVDIVLLPGRNKLYWDQVSVARLARKRGFDILSALGPRVGTHEFTGIRGRHGSVSFPHRRYDPSIDVERF